MKEKERKALEERYFKRKKKEEDFVLKTREEKQKKSSNSLDGSHQTEDLYHKSKHSIGFMVQNYPYY